jgi:iron complex outermembrane receptor protein
MQKTIQLSLLSVALLSQLNAAEISLAPLEITSTAIKTDELKSTDAVEIYTAKDIEKAHVQNIYEFLNKETSVFTTSAYGNPFMQKLDMRGYGVGDGYQNIVVTINGRKMNNVDMIPQLLASISPSSIKKIEIIKSSGIVVGGDGANAGVINIITKQSNDKEVSFYMGNYGLADGSFYFGHKGKKFSMNASGEAQKSDGVRTIDANGDKDANKFSTGTFNFSYTPTEELELRLGANFTRTDVIYGGTMTLDEYKANPKQQGTVDYGYGAGPQPSSSTHQKYDSNVISAGATYDINDALSLNVDISNEKKKSNYITYNSITDYNYKSLTATLDYTTDTLALKAGVDGFNGDLDRPNLALTKANKAAFLMSEFYLKDFTFKAGYRYETVTFKSNVESDKKESLNGVELGINYLLNKKSSLFANYSHSYETASLDRLFSFFTNTYTGYVKPAKANNYNIGYNNIYSNNKLKISLYYIDLKDEIYYDSFGYKNRNLDKSHKYGLDFYDKYLINNQINIALNYNYVQAIIDKEKEGTDDYAGNKLPGVSDHNVKATLNYLPNQYATLSLTQVWRSEAYAANDFNNNFTQKQDAYNSTDIAATYAKDNWEVFAKINNLFNQKNGLWIKDDAIYPVNFTTTAMAGFKLKY